ncbi:MAG: hypothetical protein LIP00_11085, partial [Parabacteroides sp.]|nr:hypothetical protein [Parabacteroides sp.]
MDTQPFFTPEEHKEFLSKYKLLVASLSSFLQKGNIKKMRGLLQRPETLNCYNRDKNGINGLLRNIDT